MKRLVKGALLAAASLIMATGGASAKSVKVDVGVSQAESFDHLWSKCVGAGRANEALRAGWLEHMQLAQESCGFEYVRFHGLFHDDMFPVFVENGVYRYNWQYIDDVFDRLLELNVRPFVELGFFPEALAGEDSHTVFWWKAKTTPDESKFGEWHNFIKAFTQHCVDRYGIDEVLTWYFEVWNEPNLSRAFFDGTRSQYFELYKQSVTAVRSVDNRLKVGGPSTSNFVADGRYDGESEDNSKFADISADNINKLSWKGVWIEEFLAYCKAEKLPVDFISCHPYPTDFPLDPSTGRGKDISRHVTSTKEDIEWLNRALANSAYPDAEIHLTEWSTSPNSRDEMHDKIAPAAYIVKTNLDCIGLTTSLAYWTFTDVFEEKGGGASIFHGGFGMINYQGIVKPSFHAYRMLNQLGDEKLYSDEKLFVSRHSGSGKVVAVAYNYPEEYVNSVPRGSNDITGGESRDLDLKLTGLKAGAMFKIEVLDWQSGNILDYWRAMGSPEPPTREQVAVMKQYANNLRTTTVVADKRGVCEISHEITPWSIVLIEQID
ncbi:MAG: glycoside hydrolase [Rikenellaceae bacterium]